jgi:hypothetical protein
MLKKLLVIAAGLVIAAPAFADRDHRGGHGHDKHRWKQHHHPRHHGHGHGHHYGHHRWHYARPVVVMPPPQVYYAPPRVVHAPAPVYHEPAPGGAVSIRFHFPL